MAAASVSGAGVMRVNEKLFQKPSQFRLIPSTKHELAELKLQGGPISVDVCLTRQQNVCVCGFFLIKTLPSSKMLTMTPPLDSQNILLLD